jgi:ribosomal protein S18 acetylase RimI-like enzyme
MITDAEPADGPDIQAIAARTGVFTAEEVTCVGELWQECLDRGSEVSGYRFLTDRETERILGFACYGPRDLASGVFDLYWVAVDPGAQRRSVGRGLLAASEQRVREAGGRMLIAETSGTNPLYEPARNLYLTSGYRLEATIADFYSVGDDLSVFIKRFR